MATEVAMQAHDTLPQGTESICSLLQKRVKNIYNMHHTKVSHGKGYNKKGQLKDDKSINFTTINLIKILE